MLYWEVFLKVFILSLLIFVLFNFCSTNKFKSEFDFANKLAKNGLWKEAHFRWTKSLSERKDNAAAHNNIAVALEQMKKYEEAEIEYKKALKLAPDNKFILSNYNKLKKNLKRKKNEDKKN